MPKTILPVDANATPLYGFDLDEDISRVGVNVWNPSTLAWEKMIQPVIEAGSVTVSNADGAIVDGGGSGRKAEVTDEDALKIEGKTSAAPIALRLDDVSSTLKYVGEAPVGTLENASAWRIKKLDLTSGISITWASGDSIFNKRWDLRATYIYS